MNTKLVTLFTLGITHQYYGSDDATCPDFEFVLAEHSQRALAGARLMARMNGGRLHVLFEADEHQLFETGEPPSIEADDQLAPFQDIEGLELVIGLRLRNSYFEYFTDAPPIPVQLYANTSAPKTLGAPQACDLVARSFTPTAEFAAPSTLSIFRMRDGLEMYTREVQNENDMLRIDMRFWEAGCYLVKQSSGTETSRPLILAPDLAEAGMWGVVRIVVKHEFWDSPPEHPVRPNFSIGFNARNEKLDYFVVAPANWAGNLTNISINDTASSKLTFQQLIQTEDSKDGISPSLLGVPNSKAVLFRSEQMVPRSATASRQLQLLDSNKNTLIQNLPLPSADMPLARFIVHLSKP